MDPDSFALKLANYLTCPYHDLYYREECAELLRKFLTDDDDLCTWRYLSVCTQSSIKCMILDHMKLEESKFIIQELRRTVSKLAASLLPDNNWPELLPFLYQCITNSSLNNNLKRSAFLIVGQLADDIGETTVPYVNDLRPLLLITLNDDTLPLDLRIFATRVVIRMMRRLTEKEQFHNLLPVMMRTLTDALTISEEAKDALVECAEILRKLLANDEKVLEERMRQLVVEFLTLFHKAQMEAILWPGSSVPFKTFISDHIESSKEKDAEAVWMFNMMKRMHPDSLALKLADYLTHPSRDICTREKCAKLFCKLLTDDDDLCTWHNLSSSTQSRIKCILLDCISLEESEFIIYQLRVTTSKLAASLLPDNKWPELFPSLYQCVTSCSSNNYFKESVFLIFAHLTECIGETIVPWAKTLHSLFLNTLNDDTLDLNVRMAAVRAVIRTMKTLTKKEQFQDLLPGMMRTLTDALTVGTEAAKYALEESAELLHKVLTDDEKALEERMRQLVVEFLTQFHKVQVEAILGPDSEPFQMFISDHWSSSEEKISEVKWMFNMMKYKDPNSFAIKLADYLGPSHHLYMRQECAELLYKLLTGDDDLCTWHNLSVTTQSTIKCMILDHMKLEESEFIIEVLCNTICKLAASLLLDNNWPELLPFMYQCITSASSNNKLKQSAFLIFALLAKDIGEIIVPCVKTLTSLFLNTLNDDSLNLNVRIAATAAVLSFIQCVSGSNEKERFQVLLPGVMMTLTDALSNSEEEDAAQDVLGLFIELAKNEPKFLRRQLAVVVGAKLEIAETKSLEDRTRHLAVIFLLTLVEARDKVPGMMKKLPLFTNTCFVILLNFLLDIKDEPSWHSAEIKHKDAGQTDNYIFGKNCLDRFSIALGGKTVVPIAIEQLSAYLVAPEWEKRHAALIALAQIAEGSSKVMIKYLEQVVKMVLHSIQDSHPRVRCAAILAIDRFTLDFCPVFQEQYHNQVLPALAAAMDDFQNPQLQAHAAIAVASFCESKKPETLVPHLHELLKKLVVLLKNDNQTVRGAALEAVSRIADLSKALTYMHLYLAHSISTFVMDNDG